VNGRTGIKPHGINSRSGGSLRRRLEARLPFPGGLAGNLAIIAGMFSLSVAVGAGLGKWTTDRNAELAAPPAEEFTWQEVNYSPLLGLGGPIEDLLYTDEPDEEVYADSLEQARDEANLKKEFYVITSQDSIYNALQHCGLGHAVVSSWIQVAKPYYNLAQLKPGQSFWLYLDESKRPVRFEFDIDRHSTLVIERRGEGFVARKVETPKKAGGETVAASAGRALPVPGWVDPKTGYQYYQGTVTGSFYQAAVASGMTPAKVMALIRVFGGSSFDRQVKPGDRFRVVVAPARPSGDEGPVLAAMIETSHKPRYRFRVEQGTSADYYNEKGEGGRRSSGFICPVRYARISSGYSSNRFHPILHVYRPHFGIDYAARSGTPVRAAANGVIIYASWKGQCGRTVAIRHATLTSQYAHLSGFGPGISVGKSVKQGAVIGYVGETGLATGPHLDYRMYKNGAPVNPARVTAAPAPPSAASQKAFTAARDRLLPELNRELPLGPARPWSPPAVVAKAGTD